MQRVQNAAARPVFELRPKEHVTLAFVISPLVQIQTKTQQFVDSGLQIVQGR